ncbi:putative ubiE/COQ5 methyltransferase [Lepidopterella palustris CBS 459.81]|uniref:Putative ubiE/COQ5 methyltransferase n=1 Tax=Lepidopterella palustris CBS 459.81 TaxID=1314670 RepID=A0A8E2JCE9_9PEZI|nr:putative ubiE/COQ5 methyltransferase [Lepidopterella palustris CBS 459.81]
MTSPENKTYAQGYHPSVTRSHASRTVSTDAAFLLPYLRPNQHILDIGCGPGTITTGFSAYVPGGSVTGIDVSAEVLDQARALALDKEVYNVKFDTGDILSGLAYKNGEFDVVFCSQTLCHLSDPVRGLREMKRVCAPGGIVACREGDMLFRWYPLTHGLQLFNDYMAKAMFACADRQYASIGPVYRNGSMMHAWARKAGFDPDKIMKGASTTVYASEEERKWWGMLHAERVEMSDVGRKFREAGASDSELVQMVEALREWGNDVDGWYALMQCEIICRV